MKDKSCGSCKHFKDEDTEGWGWCAFNKTKTHCAQSWDCYNGIFNGWAEITPDNVEDIKKIDVGRLSFAYQSPKGWVLYQIRMSLDFMAKHGGYYYYVLPELKID